MAGKITVSMKKMMVLAATMAVVFAGVCLGKTYNVGDSTGWVIPSSTDFYSTWASKQSFQTGDVLVFKFPNGAHTVAPVSKAAYDACDVKSLLSAAITAGPASITLNTTGAHYFICTFPGHCSGGQKLAVTVDAAGSPASTTGSSSPTTQAAPPAGNFAAPTTVGVSSLTMVAAVSAFAIMF